MKSVVKNKIKLSTTQSKISNVKKQKLKTFINKTSEKRIVSFAGLVAKLRQAIRNQDKYFIYFVSKKIIVFLKLLQEQGLIYNFYQLPDKALSQDNRLQLGPVFNIRLVVVHLKIAGSFGPALKTLNVLSVPSRSVTITYQQLLSKSNMAGPSTLYVLNTLKGLLTHTVALQYRIGGEVLCQIN